MKSLFQLAGRLTASGCAVLLSVAASAQTAPTTRIVDTHFPAGRWVAEHPSKGGIGSWWEFRADGTLTMSFGVIVNDHIDRSGDTFMMPSGMAGGDRVRARYTIRNGILSVDTGASQPATYTRIGAPLNPADPLIGSWRPLPYKADGGGNAESARNYALLQQVMSTKGMLVFTPDGMQYLRVPLGSMEGTWDQHANTFRLQNHPLTYAFGRMNSKLVLAQPPDGRELDTYLPDPLPLTTGTGAEQGANQVPVTQNAVGVVHQGPGVVMPQVTHFVEASFTDEARRRKLGGTVRVEVVVGADGIVRNLRVVKSAAEAYTSAEDREAARTLDQKAIEAVSRYTFLPGRLHDQPVPVAVSVDVDFRIY